jgi:hypothetical protein
MELSEYDRNKLLRALVYRAIDEIVDCTPIGERIPIITLHVVYPNVRIHITPNVFSVDNIREGANTLAMFTTRAEQVISFKYHTVDVMSDLCTLNRISRYTKLEFNTGETITTQTYNYGVLSGQVIRDFNDPECDGKTFGSSLMFTIDGTLLPVDKTVLFSETLQNT